MQTQSILPDRGKEVNIFEAIGNAPSKDVLLISSIRPDPMGVYHVPFCTLQNRITPFLLTSESGFCSNPVPVPAKRGRLIIYSSHQEGCNSLFVHDLFTHVTRKLTNSDDYEDKPCFDPKNPDDLYFCSDKSGMSHVWKVKFKAEETIKIEEAVQVTFGEGSDLSFCISPTKNQIVFCSNRDNQEPYQGPMPSASYCAGCLYSQIIGEPDTAKVLLKHPPGNFWEGTPVFSPDGSHLFYYSTAAATTNSPTQQLHRYNILDDTVLELTPINSKAAYPTVFNDRLVFAYQEKLHGRMKIVESNFDGGDLKTIFENNEHCWGPKFLEDGSLIFHGIIPSDSANEEDGESIDLPEGKRHFVVDKGFYGRSAEGKQYCITLREYFPSVSKSNHQMATVTAMRSLWKRHHPSSERVQATLPDNHSPFGLSMASDGTLVTALGVPFSRGEAHIAVEFPGQSEFINLTEGHGNACNVWPSITRDSKRVFFSRKDSTLKTKQLFYIDLDDKERKLHRLTWDERYNDTMPSISPKGDHVVFSSYEAVEKGFGTEYHLRALEIDPIKGSPVGEIRILTEGHVDVHPSYSPDGEKFAFSRKSGFKEEVPLKYYFGPQAFADIFMMHYNPKDTQKPKIQQITRSSNEDSTPGWAEGGAKRRESAASV